MTGSGTALDPYVIWDVNDLQAVGNEAPYGRNAYYDLGQSIDASATATWNWNAIRGVYEGFAPIGATRAAPFTGIFDGQGFAIHDLYMNWSYTSGISGRRLVGLVGCFRGTAISNLYVLDADISGYLDVNDSYIGVGIVAGETWGAGPIQQVYTSGSVYGYLRDINTPSHHCMVGGIAGLLDGGTIERCASAADATSAGFMYALTFAGGLVGHAYLGTIRDAYARGSAAGARAGGAVGSRYYGYIDKVYSTGAATSGGLVGHETGGYARVTDSFWDVQTSGRATSAGGTGKTTAEMKDILTFTDIATVGLDAPWDFVTIWDIDGIWNDGYPFFRFDPRPLIYLTVPNGGEVWDAGSTYTLLWTYTAGSRDPGTHVMIELLKGGVVDETIIASTPIGPPGGGNYNWPIDQGKAPGPDYRVRVTGVTYPYTDTSDDDFKIRGPIVPSPAPVVTTLPATGVG